MENQEIMNNEVVDAVEEVAKCDSNVFLKFGVGAAIIGAVGFVGYKLGKKFMDKKKHYCNAETTKNNDCEEVCDEEYDESDEEI